MKKPNTRTLILTVSPLLLTVFMIAVALFQENKHFSMFGLPPIMSWMMLVLLSSLGWIFAHIDNQGLFGASENSVPRLVPTSVNSDKVIEEVRKSKVVRIFASKSDTYRSLLHPHINSFNEDVVIKVLMRSGEGEIRAQELRAAADKWRSDISGRGIVVEIRTANWKIMMFKGWLFDARSGVLGWYWRDNGMTLGQSKPCYYIQDNSAIAYICEIFDSIFINGDAL